MRRICLGLLVLLAAAPGCLWSDPEVGGWMQNYNGLPWTSLMRKNAAQNSNDTWVQHPEYTQPPRFARQSGSSTPVSSTPVEAADDDAQAPPEK